MEKDAIKKSDSQSHSTQKLQRVFMGFTLQIQPRVFNIDEIENILQETVAKILPDKSVFNSKNRNHYSWDKMNPDLVEITIRPSWSVPEAWKVIYDLRQFDKILYAEPRFTLHVPLGARKSCCKTTDNPDNRDNRKKCVKAIRKVKENPEIHLELMQVIEAWKLFPENKEPGEGVVIAHPDTGFLPHPELKPRMGAEDNLKQDKYIEQKDKFKTEDALVKYVNQHKTAKPVFPLSSWHGTATASVMISPRGSPQHKNKTTGYVSGVAPGATLKPYPLGPTTYTELEYFVPGLAKAINDAVQRADAENIRVISISLGGYPTLSLRRAIINAQLQGIIVVASAGNNVPFAIWPSAYANVISVASTDFEGETLATFSAQGSRIDVAVPGEYIMVAVPTFDKGGNLDYTVEPRSGTSYAAPLVAGVAALWISYHGWDNLLKTYNNIPAKIPLVFDKLLRETCRKPNDKWDIRRWGAGIVNAHELLELDLPSPADPYIQEALAYQEIDHVDLDRGGVDTFAYLFEKVLSEQSSLERGGSIVQQVFRKVFNIDEGKDKALRQYLRTFGREIAFHIGTDEALYHQMEEVLRSLVASPTEIFEKNLGKILNQLKDRASEYLKKYLKGEIVVTDSEQSFPTVQSKEGSEETDGKDENKHILQTVSKEDIVKLQEKLTELGYNPGPIDGLWGGKTERALKQFQKDQGIEVSGQITEETWEKLGL